MANWPAQADYRDALQNPAGAFRDPVLQACQAETNKMRVPRARAGAFASVYKMTHAGGVVALKLFNFPSPDRERRYRAVSEHVTRLGARRPGCLVGFRYDPQGIRVRGEWFPLQTMDWVTGSSLGEWLRETMQKKDLTAVGTMADAWAKLVTNLQQADIAHGDLQHDNVMVVNNLPVLVDYDGMCVPGLVGNEQLEVGKPAYQHPERVTQPLTLGIDHFAAWIILVALRAVAADPTLYQRYVLAEDNENLLFSPDDLLKPAASKLWPELLRSTDPVVREWSATLRDTCGRPFSKIPPFALDPFGTLRGLCVAVPKDWAAIAAEADRLTAAGKTIPAEPPAIAQTVAGARKRAAAWAQLQAAVGDPRALDRAYQPDLVDDWPNGGPLLAQARAAKTQIALLDKLRSASAAPGSGRAFVILWDSCAAALAGVKEAEAYRQQAEGWRARARAADRYIRLFEADGSTERALADSWREVTRAVPHPDIQAAHKERGELAVRRAAVIEQLQAIPPTAGEDADRRLVAFWDEHLLAGCPEAAGLKSRLPCARKRVVLLDALDQAAAAMSATGAVEGFLKAAEPIPTGYPHRHADLVRQVRTGLSQFSELTALLAAPAPSDTAIAAAWERLSAGRPEILKRASPTLVEQCQMAVRRRDALAMFQKIDKTVSATDRQDRAWFRAWKKHGGILRGRADTEQLRMRLETAVRRYRAWEELSRALDTGDLATIRQHGDNRELTSYPPFVAKKEQINRLFAMALRVEQIQKKVKPPATEQLTAAELTFLHDYHRLFGEDDKRQIAQVVQVWLRDRAKLSFGQPPYRVLPGTLPLVMVRWGWAEAGFVSYCAVAHDRSRTLATPGEAAPYTSSVCRVEDYQRNSGGFVISPQEGADRVYVSVWAAIDLGWTTLYGSPLQIGPITLTGARRA
ncbi:hypothetical protein [Fimbriiglobus ruber]|uniref:Serine/threonine protein kinase n=1 Tax=Fimbriiglobus ruber TaxID=1908690 RepID=A0A225D0P6_9BACT|nr:hypothetical protein [Fimbriiglobus ruber]OWK34503.1 Serine/threonine protein kinase [Fimbriiglobus ruber]